MLRRQIGNHGLQTARSRQRRQFANRVLCRDNPAQSAMPSVQRVRTPDGALRIDQSGLAPAVKHASGQYQIEFLPFVTFFRAIGMADAGENPDQVAGADAGAKTVGVSIATGTCKEQDHCVILPRAKPLAEIWIWFAPYQPPGACHSTQSHSFTGTQQ